MITVGKITGHYGVRGWVKVYSYTQPMENITSYTTWYVGGKEYKGVKAKRHGKTIVAYFTGFDNREKSQQLLGAEVTIDSNDLDVLQDDDYYWHQLIGLSVQDSDGKHIGEVSSMFETGANDVMVVRVAEGDEVLIPYVRDQYVISVDLDTSTMVVDWELEAG